MYGSKDSASDTAQSQLGTTELERETRRTGKPFAIGAWHRQ